MKTDATSGTSAPHSEAAPAAGGVLAGERETVESRIARRAYQRYEARGREPGLDQDDWFEAERELRADPLAAVDTPRIA